MSIPRFHVTRIEPPAAELSEAETRHARQSRRLSAGDRIAVFDGRGRQAFGRVGATGGRTIHVAIEAVTEVSPPRPALALAFAPPKGPRQDAIVEKCTELGVAVLQPISTVRSVAGASGHRLDRWQRTAIEAAKQSGQAWLPEFRPIRSLREVLADRAEYDLRMLLVSAGNVAAETPCDNDAPACRRGSIEPRRIAEMLADLRSAGRVLALIGPEGGWSDDEIVEAIAAGVRPVSLGPNILRIETAAIALGAIVHSLLAR